MLPNAERNNPDWRRNIVMPESAARQQHAAKSTGKVPGNPNPRRSEYDEDGFLIDEDDSQVCAVIQICLICDAYGGGRVQKGVE